MSGIDAPSLGVLGGVEADGYMVGIPDGTVPGGDIWDLWSGAADGATEYEGMPISAEPTNLTIVSTSTADDVAGTGMQRASIEILRTFASKAYEVVEVDLDGTTAVSLGAGVRARNLKCIQCGSGGANAGTVTVASSDTSDRYAVAQPGENRSYEGGYTVPAGLDINIRQVAIEVNRIGNGGSGNSAIVQLGVRPFQANGFEPFRTFLVVSNDQFIQEFVIPLRVPALADVLLRTVEFQNSAGGAQDGTLTGRIEFGAA